MMNQLYLKIGCVIVTGVLIAMLAGKIDLQPTDTAPNTTVKQEPLQQEQRQQDQTTLDAPHHRETELASLQTGRIAEGSDAVDPDRREHDRSTDRPVDVSLRVGKIAATPGRDEITQIQTLPLLDSQIQRLYAISKAASCRMLTPGAAVQPNLTAPAPGQASTIGRVPSITVGLEMAEEGRNKLPMVTRGQVDNYFRIHRLSIQPVVYCDASGQYYFGTDCQAAFFELDRPGTAISPEPMIESAVARFRSLGVFTSSETESSASTKKLDTSEPTSSPETGRTLVMAFTFEKSDQLVSSVGSSDRQATELLLFHLPQRQTNAADDKPNRAGVPDIELEVFITSDDRRTLNRLDLQGSEVNSPVPTISADIRFDKMILMGMYPSEPVVTQIHYQSAGVLSMDLVKNLMNGTSDRSSISLSAILDQFTLLSQSLSRSGRMARANQTDANPSSSRTPGNIDESDESWYQDMSRRKYDRLNQSLQPIERKDSPF